jgi:hypothetical protein
MCNFMFGNKQAEIVRWLELLHIIDIPYPGIPEYGHFLIRIGHPGHWEENHFNERLI